MVTLKGFQPNYVASILKVFGSELKELKISTRCELSVLNLLACPKLEILHLDHFCTLLEPNKTDPPLSQSTFLPQIKELNSEICLGSWSHLLLNKASLVNISLRCCHIGCKEEEPANRQKKKSLRSEISVCSILNNQFNGVILIISTAGQHGLEPNSPDVAKTGRLVVPIVCRANHGHGRQSRSAIPQTEVFLAAQWFPV